MAEAEGEEVGRAPRTIELELSGALTQSCAAGDAVTVLGFVKVIAANPAAAGVCWSVNLTLIAVSLNVFHCVELSLTLSHRKVATPLHVALISAPD